MADAVIPLGASNWFGLDSSKFKAQSSTQHGNRNYGWQFDPLSNPFCSYFTDPRQDRSTTYKYISTSLASDLGTIATNLSQAELLAIDSVTLNFFATDYPEVEMVGHLHTGTTQIHDTVGFNWTSVIPESLSIGIGVGNIEGLYQIRSANDAVITSMSVNVTTGHVDILNHLGRQFRGGSINLKVSLSAAGVGRISDIFANMNFDNWRLTDWTIDDSNSSHRAWTIDAETYLPRL